MGLHRSSIRITRGRFCVEDVANVARESAWVFLFLGTYDKLKDSNPNCKCLTWFKYSCILGSLASSSPWTWPTTSLESEKNSTAFPPNFWTIVIPTSKVSYSALLFVAEKLNLKDFSIVIPSGMLGLAPHQIPYSSLLHLQRPSKIKAQIGRASCRERVCT